MIVLDFDAHKLDTSDEFNNALKAVKKHSKTWLILKKADMVSSQQLMRLYGLLMYR